MFVNRSEKAQKPVSTAAYLRFSDAPVYREVDVNGPGN